MSQFDVSLQGKNENTCRLTFEIFGDRWTLRIIDALRNEGVRFCELQERLDINSATLTVKLKRLTALKLVMRTKEADDRLPVTYSLTALGTELLPIYDGILKFGKKFLPQ